MCSLWLNHWRIRTFTVWTIWPITNKAPLVSEFITDYKLDFLCLTETWQQHNDFLQLYQAGPLWFVYICKPCSSGRGSGLPLIYHDKVMSSLPLPDQPSLELLVLKLCGPSPTIVAVLYRPPMQSNVFISEHSSLLITVRNVSKYHLNGWLNYTDRPTKMFIKILMKCWIVLL